jgi:hypothetical protein
MKKITQWALIIVSFIALVLGYALYRCVQVNRVLRASLPYLIAGESMPLEKLVNVADQNGDELILNSKQPMVIFIFPRPCTVCAKNIVYWNKMQTIFGSKVPVYGIVADSLTNAYNFWEESGKQKIIFPVYVPDNLKRFLKSFRLKLNSSQTILVNRGKVEHLIIGDLEGDSAVDFIKRVRRTR